MSEQDPRRARTVAEAAALLRVKESWLRKKAAARAIPCTFIGKHLRFSDADIAAIVANGEQEPVTARRRAGRAAGGRGKTGALRSA